MARIARVSAAALDAKTDKPKQLGSRELKRLALETTLARAIRGASQHGGRVAYRVILEKDDKSSTIKSAFKRVRQAEGIGDINLLTVDGGLYVAKRPQRRGRQPRPS